MQDWTQGKTTTIIDRQRKEMQSVEEKMLTVGYGDGSEWIIPENALPKALETAEYMRQIAHRPGSGYTPEEADEMYTLRILSEDEKWVTIFIDDYPRRCPESKVEQVLENIEKLKREYLAKGVPQEKLDKMYSIRIEKDE